VGKAKREKKVIHIPALFIEPEFDGFQNIFYEEMMTSALCLTSQPELDRHELGKNEHNHLPPSASRTSGSII